MCFEHSLGGLPRLEHRRVVVDSAARFVVQQTEAFQRDPAVARFSRHARHGPSLR
jgi:hypothetical protein